MKLPCADFIMASAEAKLPVENKKALFSEDYLRLFDEC